MPRRCSPSASRCSARPAPAPIRARSSSSTCTRARRPRSSSSATAATIPVGLRKLNQFLRDWRRNEPTKMDPRLFDLIWEAYKSSGSRDYIHVVCGYRSPQTNSMLRSRSKGVAKKSQHMLGRAMDFYIPDVKLKRLREIGLKMQGGGVGYYPSSGSPFVHFDVGNVRHWPKMSRRELIALFPDGKTLHVPSDGKPLPGFNQALASYQSRKKSGNVAIASLGTSSSAAPRVRAACWPRSSAAAGADDEEDSSTVNVAVGRAAMRLQPASASRSRRPRRSTRPRPTQGQAETRPRPTTRSASCRLNSPIRSTCRPSAQQETIVAALPARDVPLPLAAPRPQVDVGAVDQSSAGLYRRRPARRRTAGRAGVALNIPVPTPRPGNAPPPELDSAATDQAVIRGGCRPPTARAIWTCRCLPRGRAIRRPTRSRRSSQQRLEGPGRRGRR